MEHAELHGTGQWLEVTIAPFYKFTGILSADLPKCLHFGFTWKLHITGKKAYRLLSQGAKLSVQYILNKCSFGKCLSERTVTVQIIMCMSLTEEYQTWMHIGFILQTCWFSSRSMTWEMRLLLRFVQRTITDGDRVQSTEAESLIICSGHILQMFISFRKYEGVTRTSPGR